MCCSGAIHLFAEEVHSSLSKPKPGFTVFPPWTAFSLDYQLQNCPKKLCKSPWWAYKTMRPSVWKGMWCK